jgi:alpha-galactosidase
MHARATESEEVLGLEVAGPIESLGPLLDQDVRVATLRAAAQLPLSKHTLTGLKTWATAARARGIRPALCFAPFLLPERSELADRHPDWFLSDDGGGSVRLQHRGEPQLVLDPSKPRVQGWLRDLATSLKRAGIYTLELERLDACTLPGLRSPEQAPALEAYRRAIGTLRDSLGEAAYLVGTDAPIGPSIGIFDAIRMGPQPGAHWQPSWLKRLRGDSNSGAEATLVSVLSRANLHGRLWCNEAGPFTTGRMKEAEQEACRAIGSFCARSVLTVDSLDHSETESSFYWPTVAQPLCLLPTTAEQPDFIYQRWPDGSVALLAINLSSRSRELELDAETLGLVGPVQPFSISAREVLPESAGPISTGPMAPHGAVLLRLVATGGESQVLGSSLHYSAGSLGTDIERAADGTLRLHARLPGRRSGRIWYSDPAGGVRDVELGFEDEISVQLPAVESGPWERERR